MIIEQSKEQINDAIGFHSRAEIIFLRLARAKVWSRARITKSLGCPIDFDINFKPGSISLEEGSVILETDFLFAMNEAPRDRPEEQQPLIRIECSFEAEYGFKLGFMPSEPQIEAFRSANAVFNCWSFFREFVQSSVTRMHFPPPPVPFLKIVRKTEGPKIEPPSPPTLIE
jgi:hypothetical protein